MGGVGGVQDTVESLSDQDEKLDFKGRGKLLLSIQRSGGPYASLSFLSFSPPAV